MTQRCGEVVIQMLANARQTTIEPLLKTTVLPGTLIFTDEYGIHGRFDEWCYGHQSVNYKAGEYTRDYELF